MKAINFCEFSFFLLWETSLNSFVIFGYFHIKKFPQKFSADIGAKARSFRRILTDQIIVCAFLIHSFKFRFGIAMIFENFPCRVLVRRVRIFLKDIQRKFRNYDFKCFAQTFLFININLEKQEGLFPIFRQLWRLRGQFHKKFNPNNT